MRESSELVRTATESFRAAAHLGSMAPDAALRRHEAASKERATRLQTIRSALLSLRTRSDDLAEAWARWTLSSAAKVLRKVL